MHKDRDGKLILGPIWDANVGFGNMAHFGFIKPEGWFIQRPHAVWAHCSWTDRLFEDPAFVEAYITRYRELRASVFSIDHMHALIDGYVEELGTAATRNFIRWRVLGRRDLESFIISILTGKNPDSHAEEVAVMKNWIEQRILWMDEHIDELRDLAG